MRNGIKLLILASAPFALVALAGIVALALDVPRLAAAAGIVLLAGLGVLLAAVFVQLRAFGNQLGQLRNGQRRVQRALTASTTRAERDSKKLHKSLGSLRADLTRLSEQGGAQEFRLGARLERGVETVTGALASQPGAAELSSAIAREAAAELLLHQRYQPAGLIGPAQPIDPAPSLVTELIAAAVTAQPTRVLTTGLGVQSLWLAYALPGARIEALDAEDLLTATAVQHGLGDRVHQLAGLRRPDVAHHYRPWFDTTLVTGSFDVIVLAPGDLGAYPAAELLAPFLRGPVLMPNTADSQAALAAWEANGRVARVETSTPGVITVHLQAPADGTR